MTGASWQEGLAHCEGVDCGGYDEWRLPSINVLFSLANIELYDPASGFAGMPSMRFWSSSSRVGDGQNHRAFVSDIQGGSVASGDKTTPDLAVRCVQGGL